uniref:Uncharacterized protein n=1 Tax=viral metagenome TaxID=1070528 RepID=A0A6C0AD92_9ZZZZ
MSTFIRTICYPHLAIIGSGLGFLSALNYLHQKKETNSFYDVLQTEGMPMYFNVFNTLVGGSVMGVITAICWPLTIPSIMIRNIYFNKNLIKKEGNPIATEVNNTKNSEETML